MGNHKKIDKTLQNSLENSPQSDFARAKLGDSRRVERLLKITGALLDAPDKSFPQAMDSDPARLEALYRFLNNDQVESEAIIKPHIESTCQRAAALKTIYVVQDTTDLTFEARDGNYHRKGLENNGKFNQTLHVHCALAVSADGPAIVLGVLDFMTWADTEEDRVRRDPKWIKSKRWCEQAELCQQKLSENVQAIHVWDREGDSYENLAQLTDNEQRYIIRACYPNRRLLDESGQALEMDLRAALANEKISGRRTIEIGARRHSRRSDNSAKKHPPRSRRQAIIGVRAARVHLKRPDKRARDRQPLLTLNVVEVVERNPPAGQEPVSWFLLTSEPVETAKQRWNVVEGYRTRWVIEEYFKCLKTGCSIEKRQLKSRESLERTLVVLMPIAWRLLLMRDFSRNALSTLSARFLFSDTELAVLQQAVPHRKLPDSPTLGQATLAMAALGGHLKQSGPPGWITLWRGFHRLQELHTGYLMGLQRCVEG